MCFFFIYFLFLMSPSFVASGRLRFVDVAFPILFYLYSRLSLSRNPRDSMKHFEISVLRHIRFVELRKTINRTTTFNRMNL